MPAAASTSNPATPAADAVAAGAQLRALREAQGLQLDALAAAIKVSPAKLEALEAGRLGELPDLTFARALAQSVCRALKTDAAPVLARMPGAVASRLERVDEGLNTPMPERGHGLAWSGWSGWADWAPWRRPVPWLAALLLLAAAAFVLVPRHAADGAASAAPATAATPAAEVAPVAMPGAAVMAQPAASEPLAPPAVPAASVAAPSAQASAPATAAAATAASATGLQLRALQDTWVQVIDAQGTVLAARTFAAGEVVSFDAPAPLRLKIGNVAGTALQFRGQAVDLAKFHRDNVAALTLP